MRRAVRATTILRIVCTILSLCGEDPLASRPWRPYIRYVDASVAARYRLCS